MTPKKKTSASGKLVQLTARLSPAQLDFLMDSGGAGESNEQLRRILEDARTMFGLPSPMLERMAEEAKALDLDLSTYEGRRELIIRCLTECYRNLIAKDLGKKR